jgi:hypothetical protein
VDRASTEFLANVVQGHQAAGCCVLTHLTHGVEILGGQRLVIERGRVEAPGERIATARQR